MNTRPELKQKHNKRIAQYRARSDKERLELVVTPDLAHRFRQLPGLNGKTNAEKLEALCDLWLKQAAPLPAEEVLIPATGAALVSDTGIKITDALDLDQIAQDLNAFEQELAKEDASDSEPEQKQASELLSQLVWQLKPVPRQHKAPSSPPADDKQYRREMLVTIEKLYERFYPKEGKPGNVAAARARKNIPAIANLRMTHYHKLYQLLVADLLPISESELRTFSEFSQAEQRQALWTLIQSRTQVLLAD